MNQEKASPIKITRDGSVAVVRLACDENRNSLTQDMRNSIAATFHELETDMVSDAESTATAAENDGEGFRTKTKRRRKRFAEIGNVIANFGKA